MLKLSKWMEIYMQFKYMNLSFYLNFVSSLMQLFNAFQSCILRFVCFCCYFCTINNFGFWWSNPVENHWSSDLDFLCRLLYPSLTSVLTLSFSMSSDNLSSSWRMKRGACLRPRGDALVWMELLLVTRWRSTEDPSTPPGVYPSAVDR